MTYTRDTGPLETELWCDCVYPKSEITQQFQTVSSNLPPEHGIQNYHQSADLEADGSS